MVYVNRWAYSIQSMKYTVKQNGITTLKYGAAAIIFAGLIIWWWSWTVDFMADRVNRVAPALKAHGYVLVNQSDFEVSTYGQLYFAYAAIVVKDPCGHEKHAEYIEAVHINLLSANEEVTYMVLDADKDIRRIDTALQKNGIKVLKKTTLENHDIKVNGTLECGKSIDMEVWTDSGDFEDFVPDGFELVIPLLSK